MGVLQYRSNGQLDAEEADAKAKQAAQEQQAAPLIVGLAAHVRRCWDAAKDAKHSPGANGLSIRDRINSAIRRRRGLYDAQTEEIIRQNGPSKVFLKLTDEKCHAAKSWLLEALLPAGEKPWSVEPTRDPSIPPGEITRLTQEATQQAISQFGPLLEVAGWSPGMPIPPDVARAVQGMGAEMRDDLMDQLRKQARKAAQDVEDAIEDAMDEGGWGAAMAEFLDDLVTYPAAIFKGPVWESGRHMSWDEQGQPIVSTKLKLAFKRIDPNNIYPGPRATGPQDGYLIERHVLSRLSLRDLIGVDGYDEAAIKAVLEAGKTGLEDWTGLMDETERHRLLDQQQADRDPEGRIDALQFWGWVQGQQLIDYGIDAERIPDPLEEYHAEVWLVDQHVIKAELNGDPLGRRPYHAASYRPRPGSWWGEGIPELIADIQDLCNATVRALENNMAWGSGAQVGIDVGAMPEGEPLTEMFPAKIWQFDLSRAGAAGRTPIWFFQPELRAAELLKVYDYLSQEADNKTGIPRYAYGQTQTGGPIGTASGYSMMIQNMSKAIGAVISGLDIGITEPVVRMTFETLILDGVIEYRGDIDVKCQGSKAILEKNNLMARRTEFIGQVMNSEMLLELIGREGLSDILRAHVRELAIGADDAIPTAEAIRRKEELGQMQQRLAAMQQGAMPTPEQPEQPGLPQQGQPRQTQQPTQNRSPIAAATAQPQASQQRVALPPPQQQPGVANAPRS